MGGTHGEKFRKKFRSKQRVIRSPESGGTRYETLVVNPQLLRGFWTRDNFMESLVLSWAGLRVEIPFDLGGGEGPKDKSNDLAFDEVEIDGYRETEMAPFRQIQELYGNLRDRNTVDYTLRDKPEVEGEVFGDKNSLVVRWSAVETTGNGMVGKNVSVVLITSIVERGCYLDFEREDATDHLNG